MRVGSNCVATMLRRIHYVSFDNRKKGMVAPEWKPIGKGRFYFYGAGSVEYAVQQFWTELGAHRILSPSSSARGLHTARLTQSPRFAWTQPHRPRRLSSQVAAVFSAMGAGTLARKSHQRN